MERHPEPTQYEIRVRGALSERIMAAFPELSARSESRETVLVGRLPDQAALHGVIGRIESLGLELLEVLRPRPVGVVGAGSDAYASPETASSKPETDAPSAGATLERD